MLSRSGCENALESDHLTTYLTTCNAIREYDLLLQNLSASYAYELAIDRSIDRDIVLEAGTLCTSLEFNLLKVYTYR